MSWQIGVVVGVMFKIAIIAFVIFYCIRKSNLVPPIAEYVQNPEIGTRQPPKVVVVKSPRNGGEHSNRSVKRYDSNRIAAKISVGSKDCPISKVLQTFQRSVSFPVFNEKWSDFARHLGVSNAHIRERKNDLFTNKLILADALFWIIEDWVGRNGKAATLQALIQVLEDISMKECAEKLREDFIPKYCDDGQFTTVEL